MPSFLATGLSSGNIAFLMAVALVAGLARGFSGFGGALIYVPLASMAVDPKLAVVSLLVTDAVLTLGLIPDAWRQANRTETATMLAGALFGVPAGAAALLLTPPLVLRWGICATVAALAVLIASGWRYRGKPTPPLTVAVGAIAGFFGGAAQISGPPVVAYWLGGALPAATVRANIILYFGLATVITATSYYAGGLFVKEAFLLSLIAGPAFGLGIFAGTRLFGLANEVAFRRICLVLIAAAAIVGLPLFDA